MTESPTSRPPPDKQRAEVSKPNMKSVVIVRPTFRVGPAGRGAPQMTLQEAIERYGDPEISSDASPVPSGTKITTTESTPPELTSEEQPRQPAFLPRLRTYRVP